MGHPGGRWGSVRGAQADLDQGRVQLHRERRDLRDGLLRARLGSGVATELLRRDHLLHEPYLAVRRGLERPQVPGLEAEAGQLERGGGDHQRVGVEVTGPAGLDQAVGLELAEQRLVDLRGLQQLLAREPQLARAGERLRTRHPVAGQRDLGHRRHHRVDRRRLEAAVDRIEVLADHLEREVVVTLHREDVAEPVHVVAGELPVAGRGPLRVDQSLVLEEPDLGDRDPREVRPELAEHLPDVESRPRRGRSRGHGQTPWPAWLAKNTRRYLPIWTSSPSWRVTSSMRSRLT